MERGWRRALRIAAAALAAAAGLFQLSLLVRLWASRVRYPWDVEWLESSALYQAYRIMHGMSTYASPREGFLPLNHPPLYTITLATLGRIFGLDYPMARTLSLVSYLAAGALVVRALVRRHEGARLGWALGALAMGCTAAGIPVSDGFVDLVREDSLAVFLCVLLAASVDRAPELSPKRVALSAILITAIVYTRQPAVFFPVWVVAVVYYRHPRTGWALAVTATALCGLVLVVIQFVTHGWYWMHTVALVQGHGISGDRFVQAVGMLTRFAPFLAALPVLAGVLAAVRKLSAPAMLWSGLLVAAVPASLLPFAKVGGYSNDFIPVLFFIGPAAAFLAGDLLLALESRPRVRLALEAAILAAGAAFLFARAWDKKTITPDQATFARARAVNAKIAALQGGVVASRHPFLPVRNGQTTLQWSDMPYLDFMWSGFSETNLGGYIDKAHAQWAVLSGTEIPGTAHEISLRYQLEERIADPPTTIIGERSTPRFLFRLADDEKGGRVLFDFESLDGWTIQGDAFALTTNRPPAQYPLNGVVGRHVANSFNPSKGKDTARGTLISPRFLVDRPHLSLRVGGNHNGTRAELRVNGRVERTAVGIFDVQETLTRVVWDVRAFQGKEAQLWLIDDDTSPWGHLLCDHVVLY